MATQMIPVDPDVKGDEFYRYKMPAVQVKVESKGNGIKTVIPNIHDICLAINRPEEVLMKYFQFELGTQRTVSQKDDKFLLMGSHTAERMQEKIYDFIRTFVLCKNCRNPETVVEVTNKGRRTLTMTCGACGTRSVMPEHRILQFMTRHYEAGPEHSKAGKGAAEAKKKEEQSESPHEWDEEATAVKKKAPSAQAHRSSEAAPSAGVGLKDNRRNPAEVLVEAMEECGENMEQLIARMMRLMTTYNLSEKVGPRVILAALMKSREKDLLAAMRQYATLLRRFATVPELYQSTETYDEVETTALKTREWAIQKTLLTDCAVEYGQRAGADRLAVLVFFLFVEDIVRDSSILNWAKEPASGKHMPLAFEKEAKQKLQPIVGWLDHSS